MVLLFRQFRINSGIIIGIDSKVDFTISATNYLNDRTVVLQNDFEIDCTVDNKIIHKKVPKITVLFSFWNGSQY